MVGGGRLVRWEVVDWWGGMWSIGGRWSIGGVGSGDWSGGRLVGWEGGRLGRVGGG